MTHSDLDAVPLLSARSGTGGDPPPPLRRRCLPHVSRVNLVLTLHLPILILLSCLAKESSAQLDPIKNFCRRFGHQTALIDRKLYIDGGFLNYNPLSQYPTNYTNTGLHYHDLDTPGAGRMPQLYANLAKNASIPSVHGGTLWADTVNKRFYLFGGEYNQQPPPQLFTLWAYDTIFEKWESFGSPSQANIAAVSYGAGVSVPETGEGYYYGGWQSSSTVPGWKGPPVAMTGLVKYSMDSNHFSDNTGPDVIGRAEGAMVFIPIGDGGMLVYLGGVWDPRNNGTAVGQPMEQIFLYDVLSSKWYTQNATGAVPQMRRRFCAGATWAQDQSSYNIYIYGGAGMPPDTAGFDDINVLTIPSFQWIKMYPNDGNTTGAFPHHSLSCDVVDSAQMIIIGGTFPTSSGCDAPEQYGVHNVDMGQQNPEKATWQILATNLTQYAVPDPIISAVGGSASGGATKTAPDKGFNNPDLRVLMTRKASIPSRAPTRSTSTATNSPSEDTPPLPTGAIAGIAVAGVIVLLAVAVGLVWFIRRRRTTNNTKHLQAGAAPPGPVTNTPISPYPHSPFLHQHANGYHPARPVEMPVGALGANSWLGPDGAVYELVAPGSSTAVAMGANGYSNGGGGGEPQTKIDAEGRLWVQVSQISHGPGSNAGGGSPRELGGGGQQRYSPFATGGSPGSSPPPGYQGVGMEPQELSTEPRGGGDALGWGAAHGQPTHQNFY